MEGSTNETPCLLKEQERTAFYCRDLARRLLRVFVLVTYSLALLHTLTDLRRPQMRVYLSS